MTLTSAGAIWEARRLQWRAPSGLDRKGAVNSAQGSKEKDGAASCHSAQSHPTCRKPKAPRSLKKAARLAPGGQERKRHSTMLDGANLSLPPCQALTSLGRRPCTRLVVSRPRRRHRFCRFGLRGGGGRHLGSGTCGAAVRGDGRVSKLQLSLIR